MAIPEYLNTYIESKETIVRVGGPIFGIASHIEEQKRDAQLKNKTLLIVTGLSGAGKDSIVDGLINSDKRFGRLKTCTTRSKRPEENGDNDTYVRLTLEAFRDALKKGDVIESNEYAGNYYCSLISLFEKAYDNFEIPVLRVDPRGTRFYLDLWRKNEKIFSEINLVNLFVVPPSFESLQDRLYARSGDMEFAQKRVRQSMEDINFLEDAEYIVVNETGKLNDVVESVSKVIFHQIRPF